MLNARVRARAVPHINLLSPMQLTAAIRCGVQGVSTNALRRCTPYSQRTRNGPPPWHARDRGDKPLPRTRTARTRRPAHEAPVDFKAPLVGAFFLPSSAGRAASASESNRPTTTGRRASGAIKTGAIPGRHSGRHGWSWGRPRSPHGLPDWAVGACRAGEAPAPSSALRVFRRPCRQGTPGSASVWGTAPAAVQFACRVDFCQRAGRRLDRKFQPRNSRRRTFPVPVAGSASSNSSWRGTL